MGLRSSPYVCIRGYAWGDEMVKGDLSKREKPLAWDRIVLNLPGTKEYNPQLPWLYKFNSITGKIASDASSFVDDIRPTGHDQHNCELVCHQIGSRCNYLGQQDAPRKRREPSRASGMWNGSVITTDKKIYLFPPLQRSGKGGKS